MQQGPIEIAREQQIASSANMHKRQTLVPCFITNEIHQLIH
jgi:hypothetical protein